MSSAIFEITHDSLAAKIWEKVSAEEKTLMEVKNFISNSFAIYKSRGVLLTKQDLAYITPYEDKLTLDNDAIAFINRSKRFYRNQKITAAAIVAVIIGALVIGLLVIGSANKKAIAQKEKAEKAQGVAETEKKNAEREKGNAEREKIRAINAETEALKEKSNAIKEKENAVKEKAKAERETLRATNAERKANDLYVVAENARQRAESSEEMLLEQIEQIEVRDNKDLLNENPTLALIQSADLYDKLVISELKDSIKKNAFRAFNEILYIDELYLEDAIHDFSISHDGKTVLITDSTNIPKVWNLEQKKDLKLLGHFGAVTFVNSSPYKNHFITVEKNREIIFWAENYKYLDTANFKEDIVTIKYFNKGEELLIGFKNGKLAITDLRGKKRKWIRDEKMLSLEKIIVLQQTNFAFVTLSSDNKIRLWRKNMSTGEFENKLIFEGNKSIDKITSLALSPNDALLFAGTDKGLFFDSLSKNSITFRPKINLPIKAVESKNNNDVLVSTANGEYFIYDFNRNEMTKIKGGFEGRTIVKSINIPGSNRFISLEKEGGLKIWDGEAGKLFFITDSNNTTKLNNASDNSSTLELIQRRWVLKVGDSTSEFPDKNLSVTPKKNPNLLWDSVDYDDHQIKIISPSAKVSETNSTDALEIYENDLMICSIKISDLAKSRVRSRQTIRSVAISDCRKFILIKCSDRSSKIFYYIYPTSIGLFDMVKNKHF